jgi:peptidyl-prolyl cis-trans isomerase C
MQGRYKRWITVIAVGCAVVMMTWQASATDQKPAAGEGKTPGTSDVVATVNGTPIPRVEFDRSLDYAKEQFSKMGKALDEAQMKERVLDQLIASELLYQEGTKEGFQVDDKAVDEQLSQWKKQFPSDEDYQKAIKKMNVSEDIMRSDIRKDLTIQKLVMDKFVDKTSVPEEEIKSYYDAHPDMFKRPEQVQASHILIKAGPEATESEKEAALNKIKEVQEKQKKGEDFAELAKAHSECPSNAKGGDLGYFGRGQMVPPFEEAAFGMKPGEVSDIVTTQFGYHLIKVTDKKPETTVAYDEMKGRIGQYLKQEKVQNEVKTFVEKLRKEAKVEVSLGNGS